MKEKTQLDSCGVVGSCANEPETAAEFDTLAGKEGACVSFACDYIKFHRILGKFRSDLAKAVVESSGIPMKTKPHPKGTKEKVKQADGTEVEQVIQVVDEKPADYLERVAAQLGKPETFCQPEADTISATFDWKDFVKERAPSDGPSIGKRDLADALVLINRGPEALQRSLAKIATSTGKPVEVNGKTGEELQKVVANAIRDYRAAQVATLQV